MLTLLNVAAELFPAVMTSQVRALEATAAPVDPAAITMVNELFATLKYSRLPHSFRSMPHIHAFDADHHGQTA